jgi:hypothetical protein
MPRVVADRVLGIPERMFWATPHVDISARSGTSIASSPSSRTVDLARLRSDDGNERPVCIDDT